MHLTCLWLQSTEPMALIKGYYNNLNMNMELATLFMFIGAAIGTGLAVWSNTKPGKKWLQSL